MRNYLLLILIFLSSCKGIDVKVASPGTVVSAQSFSIETSSDGTGNEVDNLTLEVGTNTNFYAIKRAASGEFLGNHAVSWSKDGTSGNLLIQGAGESAEFIPLTPGVTDITILVDGKVVSTVVITVVPAANPPLIVSNLVISGITTSGFTATIDFTGGSPGQVHTLYYCNATASPGCDPSAGTSAVMSVSGSTYTATASGLSNTGDTFNVRVVSTDSVSVTGSPLNSTATIQTTGITISALTVTNKSLSGMTVTINYTGDTEDNSTVTLYYCNVTDSPGCNPTAGTSLSMTRSGSTYTATISGLTSPNDLSDDLSLRVIAVDPDGVVGSPLNSTQGLFDLQVTSLVVTNVTATGFTATVNFTGDASTNNGTATLHYCNETDNSGCNPVTGPGAMTIPMTKGATTFTVNTIGLMHANDNPGDVINMRVIGTDPQGVKHGSIGTMTATRRLTDIEATSYTVAEISQRNFIPKVILNNQDNNTNTVATFFFCDDTASPGCDPTLNAGNALSGTSTLSYSAKDHSIPAGHTVSGVIRVADAEGIYINSTFGYSIDVSVSFIIPDPVDIYRSVGPGQTAALHDGVLSTNNLTIVGGAATFSLALDNQVGVGDAIFYDSDGNNVIDSLAFIHGRTDNQTYAVSAVNGGAPVGAASHMKWKLYRAYTSLANAETGTENTGISGDAEISVVLKNFDSWSGGKDISAQTGSDENWHFALYAGTAADTSAVYFNGWTKDREHVIHIFTPKDSIHVGVSQRHAGVWDTNKYRLIVSGANALRSALSKTQVEGLQVEVSGAVNNIVGIMITSSENVVHSNIIRSVSTGTGILGLSFQDIPTTAAGTFEAWNLAYNNVVYNFTTSQSAGLFVGNSDQGGRGVRALHNTFFNNYYGVKIYSSGTYRALTLVNNLIFNSTLDINTDTYVQGTWRAWNNITSGTAINLTSNFQNNIVSADPTDIFMDHTIYDFRLKPAAAAIDYGVSINDYFTIEADDQTQYQFTTDILGTTRTGNYDVGAFED